VKYLVGFIEKGKKNPLTCGWKIKEPSNVKGFRAGRGKTLKSFQVEVWSFQPRQRGRRSRKF
jgi:hypothetical protein